MHFGGEALKLLQVYGGTQQKHAAVPQKAAPVEHGARCYGTGLFHKAGHTEAAVGQSFALLNVAEACFRACRRDAKGDDMPLLRQSSGRSYPFEKGVFIADGMVGRQHQHKRIRPVAKKGKGRKSDGWRGIARRRLQVYLELQALRGRRRQSHRTSLGEVTMQTAVYRAPVYEPTVDELETLKKLELGEGKTMIHTIRGVGYKLEAE